MVFLHSRLQHKHTDLAADANDMIVPAEYVISANAHSGTNDHDMIAQTSHPRNVNGPHYSQLNSNSFMSMHRRHNGKERICTTITATVFVIEKQSLLVLLLLSLLLLLLLIVITVTGGTVDAGPGHQARQSLLQQRNRVSPSPSSP